MTRSSEEPGYLGSLRRYVAGRKDTAIGKLFAFQRYNHKKRDEAAEAAGLVHLESYILCLLQADSQGKIDISAFRRASQELLKEEEKKGNRLNCTQHDDRSFVNFVIQQTVVVFYHLRRVKNMPQKRLQCFSRATPAIQKKLKKILDHMDPRPPTLTADAIPPHHGGGGYTPLGFRFTVEAP